MQARAIEAASDAPAEGPGPLAGHVAHPFGPQVREGGARNFCAKIFGALHLGVRLAARSRRAPYVDAIGGVTTACFWVRLMLFRALIFAGFSIEILSDLRFAASSAGVEE